MDWTAILESVRKASLERFVPALIVLVIGLLLVKLLLRLFDTAMRRSKVDRTANTLLRNCVKFLLLFVLVLILCGMVGIDVTSLVALLSVVSLAVSLSVQNALANVVSGFILLATHPFKVGDFVEIGQQSGTVQELGMFHTKIVTVDHRQVDIPNSNITANDIVNYTVLGKRRVDLFLTASYDSEPARVRQALLAAAQQPTVLADPAPQVHLDSYGDNSISYKLFVWCAAEDYWDTYYAITEAVYPQFRALGVEMSYPHVNVHFDREKPSAEAEEIKERSL